MRHPLIGPFDGPSPDARHCPIAGCTYAWNDAIEDVARERHVGAHDVDEWDTLLHAMHRNLEDARAEWKQYYEYQTAQIARAEAWASGAGWRDVTS